MGIICRGMAITLAGLSVAAWTQPPPVETVLYSFKGGSDGSNPNGGLISDKEGALYGTTSNGGGSGTVFKLTPPGKGRNAWTKTVLYSFCSLPNCSDGRLPGELASGLVFDKEGALYGTAGGGGTGDQGLVFKLTPPANGQTAWTETVLYSFNGGSDGSVPVGPIADIGGALYGTTGGGGLGSGTVFKLTPPTMGQTTWTKTGLYSFCSLPNCSDGSSPNGGLIADKEGALYGTTSGGGSSDYGTVFKLTPPKQGQTTWKETVLYSFCTKTNCSNGQDGRPRAGLIADKEGALCGTASGGGNGPGTVFKLTPPGNGQTTWKETTLYSFCTKSDCSDGSGPYAGLIADKDGALYGTTARGGSPGLGIVFKLTPPKQDQTTWKETVLYSFCSLPKCSDGAAPYLGEQLIADNEGSLYGTTGAGGVGVNPSVSPSGNGIVFKLALCPKHNDQHEKDEDHDHDGCPDFRSED
jgi:uncharacterized repeat protein (TIGR03803 family)